MAAQKKVRFWVFVGSIFAAPLLFFSTGFKPWSEGSSSRLVTLLQDVVHPFTWAWYESVHGIELAYERYIHLSGKSRENENLRKEISELKARLLDYEERINEVNRLRQLTGFTSVLTDPFAAAEVLTGYRSTAFKVIRISRGSSDGVSIGMPVITGQGVVGRVIRTGVKFSDVQLLVDFDSNIDVLIQRNRVRGILGGYTNDACRLNLQRNAEVKIGDTLVTSGIVGSFPKGLPVGKVVKISFETDQVSQVITVEPWVDPRRLEEVIVLLRQDPELSRIAEAGGAGWIDHALDVENGG